MKDNTKIYLHSAITLILMFGVGFLPTFGQMTPAGMKVLGAFVGVIYGWTTVGMLWPSMAFVLALALSGTMGMGQILAAGLGNNVACLMIFMLIFVYVLEQEHVVEFLANWMLSRKALAGRPWLFSFVLLYSLGLINGYVGGGFALMILYFSLVKDVCAKFNIPAYSKYPTVMVMGIALSGLLASNILLFKGNPLIILGAYMNATGAEINLIKYAVFNTLLMTLVLMVYILLCKYILRIDVGMMKAISAEKLGLQELTLNKRQKVSLIFLVILLSLLFLPSILPKDFILTQFLNTITTVGAVFICLIAMAIIRIDGQPLLNFQQAAAGGVNWSLVFCCLVILPLSGVLTSDAVGFKATVVQWLGPIFSGQSQLVFCLMVAVISTILTNFCNNTVIGTIFMPIIITFAAQSGFNAAPLMIVLMMCIHIAILTPAASPFAALAFGQDELVKAKDLYIYGAVTIVVILILLFIVGYPLCNILFA